MKKNVGLWIDDTKAVIVTFENGMEDVWEINSTSEVSDQTPGFTTFKTPEINLNDGNGHVNGHNGITHSDLFYNEIITFIKSAHTVLICGSQDVIEDLHKRLKRASIGDHIERETIDTLTHPQFISRVREYFRPGAGIAFQ
jgi:hypothetical protein